MWTRRTRPASSVWRQRWAARVLTSLSSGRSGHGMYVRRSGGIRRRGPHSEVARGSIAARLGALFARTVSVCEPLTGSRKLSSTGIPGEDGVDRVGVKDLATAGQVSVGCFDEAAGGRDCVAEGRATASRGICSREGNDDLAPERATAVEFGLVVEVDDDEIAGIATVVEFDLAAGVGDERTALVGTVQLSRIAGIAVDKARRARGDFVQAWATI